MPANSPQIRSFFFNDIETSAQTQLNHLKELEGAHLFLTGGTGFFGSWLLWLLKWLFEVQKVRFDVTVLSRNPSSFLKERPEFADLPFLHWCEGDIRTFHLPKTSFTHFIHGATAASAKLNEEDPLLMFETITEGTRRVLELARSCGSEGSRRFLLTSSGAIYGKQPETLSHLPESYLGAPDILKASSAYGEGKRYAEHLCSLYFKHHHIKTVMARCFAFAGPYLPWDTHFAIGNFLRDGISQKQIDIQGDGTPLRSYLYGADLAVWLLTLLLKGQPGEAYNVGAEEALSIREIAKKVSQSLNQLNRGPVTIKVAQPPTPHASAISQYIPQTQKAQKEFGLQSNFTLNETIKKSILWHDIYLSSLKS